MAHAFKTIPAKSTFGTLQEELNQSDYINIKKRKCNSILYTNKSNTILYTNKSNLIVRPQLNKSNLIFGQYNNIHLSFLHVLHINLMFSLLFHY